MGALRLFLHFAMPWRWAVLGLFGLFESSSSSSSSSSTTNIDKRIVQGDGGFAISPDSATVNILDQGAIKSAFDFAEHIGTENAGTLGQVLDFAKQTFNVGAANLQSASSVVAKAYDNAQGQGDQKTLVLYAALAVVALAAFKVFGK